MLQATLRRLQEARASEVEGEEVAEAGFTLIELMVVLLIIAILLAIAIPTFLGVTNSAGDRAAQSNLTNALTEAKALYQVNQSYTTASGSYTAGQFQAQAPEFNWTTGACTSTSNNCVSELPFNVASGNDGQGLVLAVLSSKTNTCWYAFDLEATPVSVANSGPVVTADVTGNLNTAGVYYGKKTATSAGCTASSVSPDTDAGVTFGSSSASNSGSSYSTASTIS
jgi:prepilin-type N-terminal cleavage/methylation domain-containing protein